MGVQVEAGRSRSLLDGHFYRRLGESVFASPHANQYGWEILNPSTFEVEWKDKPDLDSVKFEFKTDSRSDPRSIFGFGTITWTIPYLFVTPPGWNLIVRGPTNFWRDGAVVLDGLVETDWLPFTFTMSWKITRPFKKIKFEADDPICLIVPVRRHDVESFNPEIRNLESNQALYQQYQAWLDRRKQAAEIRHPWRACRQRARPVYPRRTSRWISVP
jgi:Family of unknown function (DUF6065)